MSLEELKEKEDKIEVGDKVYFLDDRNPMTVKARSKRYAILTQPFYRQKTVYHSIIDFEEQWKAPNNLVHNTYDYEDQQDINECLMDLMNGKVGLSQKRGMRVNIDWPKTEAAKEKRSKKNKK